MTNAGPRRILLTGATGFIGSHVARQLVGLGHSVTVLIRKDSDRWRLEDVLSCLTVIESDLECVSTARAAISATEPEICIHLAWGRPTGALAADNNLTSLAASLQLLQVLKTVGCPRLVIAGTCLEYAPSSEPITEESPLEPQGVYPSCKKALYDIAGQAGLLGGNVAVARVFYVYGPFEAEDRLVPSVVRSLLRGASVDMTPGHQVRDYLHVEDVASAICALALSDYAGAVNVSSGVPTRVSDVAAALASLMARPDLLRLGALPYRQDEPMTIVGDSTRLRSRLGWSPVWTLQAGLARTVDWWKARVEQEASLGT